MPAAYIIAHVDIDDEQTYAQYRQQVPATVARYGGEFLVRGGRSEGLEGPAPAARHVILKFPSYEQAKAWYDSVEYDGPKALRQSCSRGSLVLVEGAE